MAPSAGAVVVVANTHCTSFGIQNVCAMAFGVHPGIHDFFSMKDGAFIVNTARGDLVASAALAKALCSGKIAGAGLDTIAPEPVTTENPLLSLPHDRRGDHGGAKRTAAGKYRERVIIKSKTKTPLQLKWKSCEGVFACTATAHMGGCYCLLLAGGSGFMASSAMPSSFG